MQLIFKYSWRENDSLFDVKIDEMLPPFLDDEVSSILIFNEMSGEYLIIQVPQVLTEACLRIIKRRTNVKELQSLTSVLNYYL